MRNIDRFRAMSLEELAPYFVHRTVINGSEVWCVLVDIHLVIKMLRLKIVFIG